MQLKRHLIIVTALLIFFAVNSYSQQSDTTINGHSYNSVTWHQGWDPKGGDVLHVIAFGNYKNGVRHGRWIYALENGTILAQGKYRNGYKVREWIYRDPSGEYYDILWGRYHHVVDKVDCSNAQFPVLIDYDAVERQVLRTHGMNRKPCKPVYHFI
jgi:hypothetical protein